MEFKEWRNLVIKTMGLDYLEPDTYNPNYDPDMENDIKMLYNKARED